MATRIQLRRDTAANWTSEDPVLASGEIGIETDASPIRFKIGDGTTAWTSLAYYASATTGASIEDAIAAASADTVADADEWGFRQVAGSLFKKITWANIKATLKTYFDTLYAPGDVIDGGDAGSF
jgi:hypothetical protein